ncbi:hypothetical protein C8R47DRAFT_1211024 [Mycena vitilis]|nr:hypothetical protein C8R47DRAFT_1211024 [Mycena vitilis]
MSPKPSAFEAALACGDAVFLGRFFRYWEPSAVFKLAQLNFLLLNVVRWYQSMVWSVPDFLSDWFSDPERVFDFLDTGPAVLCGPSVLQFLDRSSTDKTRLDMFLAGEGYVFRPGPASTVKDFALVVLLEAISYPERRLKLDGDRTTTQEDHTSRAFRFVKFSRHSCSSVVILHLVRCELHRFVMSAHSTSLMNFISGTHVVSLFARSTFHSRKSFVSCQERLPVSDPGIRAEGRWLSMYSGDLGGFHVVGAVAEVDADLEVGNRWIGDSRCWWFPCIPKANPFEPSSTTTPARTAFDVLDWTTGVTRHGSYLRVGEPFFLGPDQAK